MIQPRSRTQPPTELMQRRVLRLLSLYDQQLFRSRFRVFFAESTLPRPPLLQQYDRYLKLLLLSEELLNDILPRLLRQLGSQETRLYRQEEAPTRGEIDWSRTLQQTMDTSPDQPPLRFETRQHQRSFASPENMLVAALLLNYQSTLNAVLHEDLADEALSAQERQLLSNAQERVERELVTFHALQEEARRAEIEPLVTRVAAQLHPGPSPHRDLIAWWEQFHDLHIAKVADTSRSALLRRRSDEQQDTWLYELWLLLELLHMLSQRQAIDAESLQLSPDTISFLFIWQDRRFRLRYHRHVSALEGHLHDWEHAPSLSAAYRIEREQPLTIAPEGTLTWREPPFLMGACFLATEAQTSSARHPINELFGDMQLLGATHALLCLPSLPATGAEGHEYVRITQPARQKYHSGQTRETRLGLYALPPGQELTTLHPRFEELLNLAVEHLPDRPPVACHGIRLDAETVNATRIVPTSYDTLCPKPHIGAGVFDLVNDQQHCLKDACLCHVMGQAILPPFVVRATTLDALSQQSSDLRARNDDMLRQAEEAQDEARAEQLRSSIFLALGRAVEQYVRVRGNTASIEKQYEEWVFGQYWKQHPRALAEDTRHILLSAAYMWDEYQNNTTLEDWTPPAMQYCRALETEIKRRLHDYYPVSKNGGFRVPGNKMTLGTFEFMYEPKHQDMEDVKYNWHLCNTLVQQSGAKPDDFAAIIARMVKDQIRDRRNKLAHTGVIAKDVAQALRKTIIGQSDNPGILLWLVKHLQPKPPESVIGSG